MRCFMRHMTDEEEELRCLGDGIYEVPTSIDIVEVEDWGKNFCEGWYYFDLDNPKVQAFITTYPDWRYACAYETGSPLLLSAPPLKFQGQHLGTGFNYGSTNLLTNCPNRILILAQND